MRTIEERIIEGNKKLAQLAGKSTETKPTENLIDGSTFVETDTGKVFVYCETDTEWNELGGT